MRALSGISLGKSVLLIEMGTDPDAAPDGYREEAAPDVRLPDPDIIPDPDMRLPDPDMRPDRAESNPEPDNSPDPPAGSPEPEGSPDPEGSPEALPDFRVPEAAEERRPEEGGTEEELTWPLALRHS